MSRNHRYDISVALQRDLMKISKLASVRALICVIDLKSLCRPGSVCSHHGSCLFLAVECWGVWGRPEASCRKHHAAQADVFQLFGDTNYVTTKTLQSIRRNTLALATALALTSPALMAAGNNEVSARINMSAIGSDTQFDRFIVKYREGTPEAKNAATLQKALNDASVRTHQLIQSARAQQGLKSSAAKKPLAIGHVRRMSLGADVIEPGTIRADVVQCDDLVGISWCVAISAMALAAVVFEDCLALFCQ